MKRCIIIGNGPSLKDIPNGVLDGADTFGTNGILLKYDPTYYVAVNPLAIERFAPLIKNSHARKFLRANSFSESELDYTPLWSMPTPLFAYNPLQWLYEGYNVTFVCLQLAFFMGYEEVVLLGVDHKYVAEGQPNEEQVLQGEDPNHFSPEYFKDSKWHLPDLQRSEHAYALALQAFADDGRRIYNCTKDSALDIFEKAELPTWLAL